MVPEVSKKAEVRSMMTLNVRVEKPDIILVESMDDINCNAIILNVSTCPYYSIVALSFITYLLKFIFISIFILNNLS